MTRILSLIAAKWVQVSLGALFIQPFANRTWFIVQYFTKHSSKSILCDSEKHSHFYIEERKNRQFSSNYGFLYLQVKCNMRFCLWRNGYRCSKRTEQPMFESWAKVLIILHSTKKRIWIQVISFQLWVNSWVSNALYIWYFDWFRIIITLKSKSVLDSVDYGFHWVIKIQDAMNE